LYNGKEVWGRIEVSFRPVMPTTILGYADNSLVLLVAVMLLGGFPVYLLLVPAPRAAAVQAEKSQRGSGGQAARMRTLARRS